MIVNTTFPMAVECPSIVEHIHVDNDDVVEELIPWTLEAYIKLSNIKYPSKARFYCVKKFAKSML